MQKLFAGLVFATLASHAQVVGVGNFIHDVSDLDKSVAFYRDVIGMELQRPVGAFSDAPEVPKLYNAIGAQFRVASVQIAGSPMRAELVEFKGVERRPVRPNILDPGASVLMLTVRELDPISARIRAAGLRTLPVPSTLIQGRRALAVADPDGFFVELIEGENLPAQPAGNIVDMAFAFVVRDAKAMARVFLALGITPGPSGNFEVMTANFPNPFHIHIVESKGAAAKLSRPQDPGTGVLRFVVKDAAAAVDALSKVGVKVASANGEIVSLPAGGTRHILAAILSAPDNLFLQVLQQ